MTVPPGAPEQRAYEVGKPIPGFVGPQPEGAKVHLDSTGFTLLHLYDGPTPREVRGARTGRTRFGLVPAGRHTLLLIYSIELLTDGWSDAPYALGLVRPEMRNIPAASPGHGRILQSILADTASGTLHALRAVSLTPSFAAALDGLLAEQRRHLADFTPAAHAAEIAAAYGRYPDSSALAKAAIIIEQGGLPMEPHS